MEQSITAFGAVILGAVEGITEFIPVSSTGHLILVSHLLGYGGDRVQVFEVVIQVGAILAVCGLYFARLWEALTGLGRDRAARHFALTVIIAFVPAGVLGVLFHGVIQQLFSPLVVAISLIVGGTAILIIEKVRPRSRYRDAQALPLGVALGIGLFQCLSLIPGVSRARQALPLGVAFGIGLSQCLSLIPGVSRAGASIRGALLLKVERRAAAEFSFFLAIPTIVGAAVFEGWKSRDLITGSDMTAMII